MQYKLLFTLNIYFLKINFFSEISVYVAKDAIRKFMEGNLR